jgi:hypothetical protein
MTTLSPISPAIPIQIQTRSAVTASPATVIESTDILPARPDGLGVQATVDGGPLSEDELKAIGVLGSAFQAVVDGLTDEP